MQLTFHAPGTQLEHASQWAGLPPDELKRRAAVAANERNIEALWSLTRAHLYLHGSKGARVSEGTLRQYKTGVHVLMASSATRTSTSRPRPRTP